MSSIVWGWTSVCDHEILCCLHLYLPPPLPPTLPRIFSLLSCFHILHKKHKSESHRSRNLHGKVGLQLRGGFIWKTGALGWLQVSEEDEESLRWRLLLLLLLLQEATSCRWSYNAGLLVLSSCKAQHLNKILVLVTCLLSGAHHWSSDVKAADAARPHRLCPHRSVSSTHAALRSPSIIH